jgi:hypothetical protein
VTPRASLIALVAVSVTLTSCGGGSDDHASGGTSSTASATVPAAVAAQANANCQDLVRQAKRLATGVIQRYHHSFESLTAIVTQGIPIVEQTANQQRALVPAAHSSAYALYVDLFDPLIVLLQERLRAGKAQDPVASRRLNGLVTGLSFEQKDAARAAGLTACNVDFKDVVTQAAFGNRG